MLKTEDLLSPDQRACIDRLYQYDHTLLYADMGAGKTVCTLRAINDLIADGVLKRVLVVAPLQVCVSVWATEHLGWAGLSQMRVSVLTGDLKSRLAVLKSDAYLTADVVVVNFENLPWLLNKKDKALNKLRGVFDGLVVDEITRMRKSGGGQFKALRVWLPTFTWRVGLTGTPVAEDWLGLFGMLLVVDGGAAFGRNAETFKRKYFYAEDYHGRNWQLHEWAAEKITEKIVRCLHRLPDYRDDLPPITHQKHMLGLPPAVRVVYDCLRRYKVYEGTYAGLALKVIAESAAVLSAKLEQIACGFVYENDGENEFIFSDFRIHACCALVCTLVTSAGSSVMLAYWFDADRVRLLKRIEALGLRIGELGSAVDAGVKNNTIDAWNAGGLDVLLIHPRSAGHGLNLQAGGCEVVWYCPVWSNDVTLQLESRLWRRGQTKAVRVHTFVALDTVDEIKNNRVADKAQHDEMFKFHIA